MNKELMKKLDSESELIDEEDKEDQERDPSQIAVTNKQQL